MKKKIIFISLIISCLLAFSLVSFAATGHEDEATKITKDSTTWTGWMIAEGKIEINANVEVKGICNLILADDAELTVNGKISVYSNDISNMLNVYASDAGTGVLNVNCSKTEIHAYEGNITVNGGTVNIDGGSGSANVGLFYGAFVTVNDGVLNVKGTSAGATGVSSCAVTVNGGEMNIQGGDGETFAGEGATDTGFTVNGGVVTIAGGEIDGRGREFAYDGEDGWNVNVKAYGSSDGVNYNKITNSYRKCYFLKFYSEKPTPVKTSFIDEDGSEKTADAVIMDEGVLLDPLKGWYVVTKDKTIDGSLEFKGDVNIIIEDGVDFEILGALNSNGYRLSIFTQKEDTAKIKIISDTFGVKGNVRICGGETEILGGKNSPAIYISSIIVTGTAKVNAIAGNSETDDVGPSGADNSTVRVSGNGELTIKGGSGKNKGGCGISYFAISVTDNGVLILSGGEKTGQDNEKGDIFGGKIDYIQGKMFTSDDGVNFTLVDENIKNNPLLANTSDFVKITDVDHTYVPYIDENGKEQTVKDPMIIGQYTTKWDGWVVVNESIEIFGDISLEGNTNLILADGAGLTINGGSIHNNYNVLKIYAQSTGDNAGRLSVKGLGKVIENVKINSNLSGIDGNVFINGGIIDIVGGSDSSGIYGNVYVTNGKITVTGGYNGNGIEGNVEISDGKMAVNAGEVINPSSYIDDVVEEGASGIKGFYINVKGGELTAKGSGCGYGIEDSNITVSGGTAIVTGGKDYISYLRKNSKGCAYNKNIDLINARIEISVDGINYEPYNRGYNGSFISDYPYSLRLTAQMNEQDSAHNTGDENNIVLLIAFAVICTMAFISIINYRKREN